MGMRFINRTNLEVDVKSTDAGCYAYNGIHFKEEFSETTDGRILLRVPYPDICADEFPHCVPDSDKEPLNGEAFILPAEGVKKLLKVMPNNRMRDILNNIALTKAERFDVHGQVMASCTDLDAIFNVKLRPLEGNFPNTDDVMAGLEKRNPGIKVTLGVPVLEKLLKAAKKAYALEGNKDNQYIELNFDSVNAETETIYVRFSGMRDEQQVTGAFMPVFTK